MVKGSPDFQATAAFVFMWMYGFELEVGRATAWLLQMMKHYKPAYGRGSISVFHFEKTHQTRGLFQPPFNG